MERLAGVTHHIVDSLHNGERCVTHRLLRGPLLLQPLQLRLLRVMHKCSLALRGDNSQSVNQSPLRRWRWPQLPPRQQTSRKSANEQSATCASLSKPVGAAP